MDEYIERLRDAAKAAEDYAVSDEEIAYAQGAYDILGHLMVNPTGRPVNLRQVRATASQLAKILGEL